MSTQNPPKGIPYNNLAFGIQHGPYQGLPKQMAEHYIANREQLGVQSELSDAQLLADTQSEWQYDQHSGAVMEALDSGMISADHAMYMLEKVLRPWFIGRRIAKDLNQAGG